MSDVIKVEQFPLTLPSNGNRILPFYSLRQLMELSDQDLLFLFTDISCYQSSKRANYRCYLLPETCSRMCEVRHYRSPEREMLAHLRNHIQQLLFESQFASCSEDYDDSSADLAPAEQKFVPFQMTSSYDTIAQCINSSADDENQKIGPKEMRPKSEINPSRLGFSSLNEFPEETTLGPSVSDNHPSDDHAYTYLTGPARAATREPQPTGHQRTVDTLEEILNDGDNLSPSTILPQVQLQRIPLIITDAASSLFSRSLIGAQEIVSSHSDSESKRPASAGLVTASGLHTSTADRRPTYGRRRRAGPQRTIVIEPPPDLASATAGGAVDDDVMTELLVAAHKATIELQHQIDESLDDDFVDQDGPVVDEVHQERPVDRLIPGQIDFTSKGHFPPISKGAGFSSSVEFADEVESLDEAANQERRMALECIRDMRRLHSRAGGRPAQNTNPILCRLCSRQFTAFSSLLSHYRSHAGVKPFICMQCNRSFTRQSSLNYHMLVHENLARFECESCGRRFRHKSHYREHLRTHTGEKPFSCMACNMQYHSRTTFKRHLKLKHYKGLTKDGLITYDEDFNQIDGPEEDMRWPNLTMTAKTMTRMRSTGSGYPNQLGLPAGRRLRRRTKGLASSDEDELDFDDETSDSSVDEQID